MRQPPLEVGAQKAQIPTSPSSSDRPDSQPLESCSSLARVTRIARPKTIALYGSTWECEARSLLLTDEHDNHRPIGRSRRGRRRWHWPAARIAGFPSRLVVAARADRFQGILYRVILPQDSCTSSCNRPSEDPQEMGRTRHFLQVGATGFEPATSTSRT